MIAMLSPRIEVLKEHRTVSAKQIRYVVSNLLVLVRRSLAAPPLVNRKLMPDKPNRAYTTRSGRSRCHFKPGPRIEAERNNWGQSKNCSGFDYRGVRKSNFYSDPNYPRQRSNAESRKLASKGLWVI